MFQANQQIGIYSLVKRIGRGGFGEVWLAERSDVDATRLGLLGWSNGGSTVLAATNEHHKEAAAAEVKPAFAIAFYPGCEAELRRGYETHTQLLMMVGELGTTGHRRMPAGGWRTRRRAASPSSSRTRVPITASTPRRPCACAPTSPMECTRARA